MKKTLKAGISVILSLIMLMCAVPLASAAGYGYAYPEKYYMEINYYNDFAYFSIDTEFSDEVYYNFDIGYYNVSVEWDEWTGDTAWFKIYPQALGEEDITFTLRDYETDALLDEVTVTFSVINPEITPAYTAVNLITGGSRIITIPMFMMDYIPFDYVLWVESDNPEIKAEWLGKWYGEVWDVTDLRLTATGTRDTTGTVTVTLRDEYENYISEITIYVDVMKNYDPGTPIMADADLDGTVTVSDARLCLRAAIGLDYLRGEGFNQADVDYDDKITVNDARTILRCAIGLEDYVNYGSYENIILSEYAKDAARVSQFTLFDIDGNKCKELIVKHSVDGKFRYDVYTIDNYGWITWCGYLGDVQLYTKDGTLYAVSAGGGSMTVWQCLLDKNMCLSTYKTYSATGLSTYNYPGVKVDLISTEYLLS